MPPAGPGCEQPGPPAWWDVGLDTLGVAADVGALLLPGVPGGASVAIKATRIGRAINAVNDIRTIQRGSRIVEGSAWAQRGIHGLRLGNAVANAYQGARGIGNGIEAFEQGSYLEGALYFVGGGLGMSHLVGDVSGMAIRAARRGAIPREHWSVIQAAITRRNRLQRLQQAGYDRSKYSRNLTGPVVSAVRDTRTGRTYFGRNTEDVSFEDLVPMLQARVAELARVSGRAIHEIEIHAEVVALNKALQANSTDDLSGFLLANARFSFNKISNIERCMDCRPLTRGVISLADGY